MLKEGLASFSSQLVEFATPLEAASSLSLPLKVSEKEFAISPEKIREPVKYVIFDLDGTLVYVLPQHRNIYANAMHDMLGISTKTAKDHYMTVAGRRTNFQVDSLLDKSGLDIDSIVEVRRGHRNKKRVLTEEYINKVKRSIYEQKSKAKGSPFPHVSLMLRALVADEVRLGVSTFSKEKDAIEKLRHAGILDFFAIDSNAGNGNKEYAIVGRDSIGLSTNLRKGKPHFELLSYIFSVPYTELTKQGCFISDTVEDLEEADFMRRIGIAGEAHTKKQLLQIGVNSARDWREYSHIPSLIRFI